MVVFEGSRYDGARVTQVVDSDGVVRKYVHDSKLVTPDRLGPGSGSFTWLAGTEWDSVSYEAYGSESAWWVIAQANGVLFPFEDLDEQGINDVVAGRVYTIPGRSVVSELGL